MLDHLVLSVSDLDRSIAFYLHALAPLGINNVVEYNGSDGHADLKGFGKDGRIFFWLKLGEPAPATVHFCFQALSRAEIDEFHAAAIAAGGQDNGAPGVRLQYYPGYHAAYVLDPDGYNIEAVYKS